MKPETANLICSPFDHEPLQLSETPVGQILKGVRSGAGFQIRDGIPILMDRAKLSREGEISRRYYDTVAPLYSFAQSAYYRLKGGELESRNQYLNKVRVKKGGRLLEVAVGNGTNIRYLPRGAEYFGIDVSWKQLVRCRRTAQRSGFEIELFQADAEHLPFHDNIFDFVFNVGSMNYFGNKRSAIGEMLRVARPGAGIMIADETERAARAHNRLPIFRGFFGRAASTARPPVENLPADASDVELNEIRGGFYYTLLFRKSG